MTLYQPEPADRQRLLALGIPCADEGGAVRVGLLNIMPQAHRYERYLLQALSRLPVAVEPVYVRLATHGYRSTPQQERERYRCWEDRADSVDALLLTGAPVEHLPFHQVTYWPELTAVLDDAVSRKLPVLGICWGGLVLAHRMGLTPEVYNRKLFGLLGGQSRPGVDLGGDTEGRFLCPHSRFAGLNPDAVAEACHAERCRLLAAGPEAGPFIVESPEGLLLGHLGHPEYPAGRLEAEWERDQAAGRTDVPPPSGLSGHSGVLCWEDHRNRVFSRWLGHVPRLKAPGRKKGVTATGGKR